MEPAVVVEGFARVLFAIADRSLSQDDGELTPTMKVKREKVYENFCEQIDGLYDD